MHSQHPSGKLLLLVQLVLLSICIPSFAAPISLSKNQYTDVQAEAERAMDSLQSNNKASEPIRHTESGQPTTMRSNIEPAAIETRHTQQEALASDIKNFVPDTLAGEMHQVVRTAPMQNRDLGSENYIGVDHPQNPEGNELKEYTASNVAASHFTSAQHIKVDLPEQINNKEKAVLKNADKSKRLSIFSVLHPALAAALTSEKVPEKTNIPRAPLKDVDYTTGPLKGTESHDRDALPYASTVPSRQAILAQIQEAVPRAPDSRRVKQTDREFGHEEGRPIEEEEMSNKHSQRSKTVDDVAGSLDADHPLQGQFPRQERIVSHPKGGSQTETVDSEEQRERGVHTLKSEINAKSYYGSPERISENSENSKDSVRHSSALTPHSNASLNITVVQERSGIDKIMKTTARYWHGFVGRVKRVVDALKTPTSSRSQTPDSKMKDDFTEDDVQDMVNEIVHDLQRRNEGGLVSGKIIKHSNPLQNAAFEGDSSDSGKQGSLLMLRTKTLVSPDAVADAVTSAARRMLSERGDSVSRETSSRFLREVQDKMEELLQPME